ncbi:MAG: hypothetical protein RLZ98_2169 [Pseudomonadota bacterium]
MHNIKGKPVGSIQWMIRTLRDTTRISVSKDVQADTIPLSPIRSNADA